MLFTSASEYVCINKYTHTFYRHVYRYVHSPTRTVAETCFFHLQGLQILLMSGVTVTSASQILESFWKIWSQVSQRKKPFSDFTARGPGVNNYRDGYTV